MDNFNLGEITARTRSDVGSILEALGFTHSVSDAFAAIELLTQQAFHQIIPSEFLRTALSRAINAIDLLFTARPDYVIPIEYLSRKFSDASALLEVVSSANFIADVKLALETISSIATDRFALITFLQRLLNDSSNPLTLLSAAFNRSNSVIESLTSKVRPDSIIPISFLNPLQLDLPALAEFPFPLQRHFVLPIESSGIGLIVNFVVPMEGFVQLPINYVTPTDFSGSIALGQDQLLQAESLFSQQSDHRKLLEYVNATVQRFGDTLTSIEFLISTASDAQAVLDSLQSAQLDVNFEIEFNGVPVITLLSSVGRLARSVKIRIVRVK